MFDVGLRANGTGLPFQRQLPFFNWFYPFDVEAARMPKTLAAYAEIDWSSIRRRAAYFHVPFCETICSFCPFVRGHYAADQDVEDYLQALLYELRLKRPFVGRLSVDSIFIGGGTPSVLTPRQIKRLGDAIHLYLDTSKTQEFAVEVEVKSVTQEKLSALKGIGVNRISFGVQTFSREHRKALRLDAEIAQITRVAEWSNALFPYTNVDIIHGIAGQEVEDAIRDADAAINLRTTSIDFYPLNNLAAQPSMHKAFREAGLAPLTAAQRLEQRQAIARHMLSKGYARISGYSYARRRGASERLVQRSPNFLYHDILYGHHDDAVVGYGAAALTQVPGYNFYNTVGRREYISSVLGRRALPASAYDVGASPEKAIVTFPYRGVLARSRVPWKAVPDATLSALGELVRAGLVVETRNSFEVTESGWLFYVNLMYFMMPPAGKDWISQRIATRMVGRDCEKTEL